MPNYADQIKKYLTFIYMHWMIFIPDFFVKIVMSIQNDSTNLQKTWKLILHAKK